MAFGNNYFILMPNFSTRYKIAVGYILLTLMLITTMGYVYRIMRTMSNKGDVYELLSVRRGYVIEIINDLNKAEIIVQTIAIGKTDEYPAYNSVMSSVYNTIDSLRSITTDADSYGNLDAICMLMKVKDSNVNSLMNIIRNNDIEKLYNEEIKDFLSLQQSLLANRSSLRNPDAVFDTISNHLKEMQWRVSMNHRQRIDELNGQMRSLRMSSLLLNDEVRLMLNEIENEERRLSQAQIDKNEKVRNRAYLIISGIAVISILLVALFLYFIWKDISRSNHYRMELEKAKQRAEDLLEAKDKLMLTITHDIKAPVGSIIGYAELLGNITTGERQQFYLQNMQGSANHLLQLVNSLLDFHRLDADKMDCQRVPFNVKELFDSIINSYRPVAANRNIELASSCAPELDSVFKGDPLRIRQIIDNLVGNAFKFTKEGSVAVNAMLKGESLHITVSDTGCGISAEDMNRIFKEFTRLKNAQGKEGFGLGLAITNKLVRLLGGEIDVRSRQGEGTTFEVRLPLEHTEQSMNSNVKETGDFVVPGARLLLIDDDPLQLSMMEAMLKHSPLVVTTCNHPDEFFIYLQQQQYDVIITDIQMPAMNGIDLINKIKEFPNAAQVPVIAMTARSDMDAELLSQHGFATCLHKPFASKELLSVIASVVEKGGSKIDFSQLTAFSMDDDEAKAEIMQTFVSETKKKRDLLQQACEKRDMPAVTTITHQLLPLFVMVGAVNGKEHLEWFEKHRNDTLFTDDAGARIVIVIEEVDKIITEAEKELTR